MRTPARVAVTIPQIKKEGYKMAKYYVVVNNKEDCQECFLENSCMLYTEKQFDEASKNKYKINIHSKIDVFNNLADAQEWCIEMNL
jgi:hypothetical protein